ncbi:MAG: NAD-dependent DNA ligase LigA [Chitinivibrionales bacterium]
MSDIEQRINKLRDQIKYYDAAYYGRGESLISDRDYDELYHELEKLEREYPQFNTPNSPTKRVGNDLTKEFPKVCHVVPLMSIDNTYAADEVREWVARCEKLLQGRRLTFVGELKVDGVAAALTYEKGRLVRGATRGDGIVGDDVTPNIRTIRGVPLTIDYDALFEVRGEVYLTFENFKKLNDQIVESGQRPMQNPRNTTSGTLKLLDPAEVWRRNLSFGAYYLRDDVHRESHLANIEYLKQMGFPVVEHSSRLISVDEILSFCHEWEQKRYTLDFPVDGIVIKIENIGYQDLLGSTGKSPRWVIAFKYPPETAVTKLLAIDGQVGRTGVITPVARLEPVFLAGTTISNATLHNYNEVIRLDVRVGDFIEIEKGGEIIPKIIRILPEKRELNIQPFIPPKKCPRCESKLVQEEDEVALRCPNTISCPDQLHAAITHFASRQAMNIKNVGPALIQQLIDKALIRDVADIYKLTKDNLLKLEGFADLSAENVIKAIKDSKSNSVDRVLFGLGIPGIGVQAARAFVKEKSDKKLLNEITDIFKLSTENLRTPKHIGEESAAFLFTFFRNSHFQQIVHKLKSLGVNMKVDKEVTSTGYFTEKTVVFTGELSTLSRPDAEQLIVKQGGKPMNKVSKKTNYVIAGPGAGSKLKDAEHFGIPILSESDFLKLVKNESNHE